MSAGSDLDAAATVLAAFGTGEAATDAGARRVRVPARDRPHMATAVVQAMAEAGLFLDEAIVRRPSLDEAFLALTGSGNAGVRR